ncbi:hypothetical protein ADL30_21485 [Streptomyces sp. NRRL S-1521]|nr:hypothetical protein ADL30_21485 [Streptomyces sp. NRRL S-1521]
MRLLDEAQVEQEVGGLEPHVGFESRVAAQGHGPVPRGRALGFHHPGVVRQRAQRRHRVVGVRSAGRSPRCERQREAQVVVEQVRLFEFGGPRVRAAGVLLGEHQVEIAGLQRGGGVLRFHVRDVDAQPRVLIAQQSERGRDQGQGRRLERGDAQRAGEVGQRGGDLRLGALQAGEDRFGVGDEDLGLLGQPHPPPDRFQQRDADLGLQLGELLGDGGGRVGQG